jgi:hypothetical protein
MYFNLCGALKPKGLKERKNVDPFKSSLLFFVLQESYPPEACCDCPKARAPATKVAEISRSS